MGIVTAEMLRQRSYPEALWRCGGIELRADGVPPGEIPAAVSDFQAEKKRRDFDGPVVFTLRLERDGGAWKNEEASARETVWRELPVGACEYADLEIEEIDRIDPSAVRLLRDLGARILLSHHAFVPEAPERWPEHLEAMRRHAPDGVKFAVQVTEAQVDALLAFARAVGAEFPVSGVLGMGEAGMPTRLLSPLLGCPLTYGFLGGSAPLAPGQVDVATMQDFFDFARRNFPGLEAENDDLVKWVRMFLAGQSA